MTMISRLWATGVMLLAQLLLVQAASAKDDFLPPEQAYRYATRVEGDRVIVAWTIEPGYYLYKKKMGVVSAASDVQLGEPLWPKGEDHTDEYFGTQEIYRGKVEVPVPFTIAGRAPGEARARAAAAGLRGCRPVLSAAEVEDRSRTARCRHRAAASRRPERAARQEIRRRRTTATSCRPTKRSASAPACRSRTRSR